MYSNTTPVSLGDLSYLNSVYYDLSLLKAIVPYSLIPDIYENMQTPLSRIVEGAVPLNNTVNGLFSWDEYRDNKNPNTMVISYQEYSKIMSFVKQGSHPQFNLIITNEVTATGGDEL